MNQKLERRKEDESFRFTELVNFLGHAAYRAAVITQYPDEYNRIVQLECKVRDSLETLSLKLSIDVQKSLIKELVNAIVLEYSIEKIRDMITDIIYSDYHDDELKDINFKSQLDGTTDATLKLAKNLHHCHSNWQTNIYHRCTPSGLICNTNLLDVVNYVETKEFIPKKEMVDGILQINIISPPFTLIPLYRNSPKHFFRSKQSDLIPIPETSLFNRYFKEDPLCKITLSNETQLSALYHLDFLNKDTNYAKFTESLYIKVDLRSPIDKQDMELLMNELHKNILHHQSLNMNSALLLSENIEQLEETYSSYLELDRFNLGNYMHLTKYPLKGINSFSDIKRALLGLMAWYEHFTTFGENNSIKYNKSKSGQYDSFAKVSENFHDNNMNIKRGFGINSITKGYSLINVAIQQELILQRRGRFQARKISVQRMQALRDAPIYPFSKLHENDISIVNARLERICQRGNTGVIKQHQDGSIWVIPI